VTSTVTLTTINNDFSAFAPTSPANGASGVNLQPPLFWNAVPDADAYDAELATSPSFEPSTLIASRYNILVDSFQVNVPLQEGKIYFWRARPKNSCGFGPWSEAQVFVVAIQSCVTKEATDLPKTITANGTPTIESVINFASGGAISDVNVKKVQGNHTFFKDLEAHLISPTGTDVLLWKDKCSGYNGSFNFGMDDGASAAFNCPPPNNALSYKPVSPLNVLNGQNAAGNWILRVKDNVISSGGSISGFELQICSNVALDPPLIVTNSPLTLAPGSNAVIGDVLLKAQDPNNGPAELIFTLLTVPANGQLQVNGQTAEIGRQFTQADINSGALRYYDFGLNLGNDQFKFAVTDGNGGLASGTYIVQPFAVGTHSPVSEFSFEMAPNPTSATTQIQLKEAFSSDARVNLLNASGQLVSNWELPAGQTSLTLSLQHLPKGIYSVALLSEKGKVVRNLVLN
jgi:subtilisin-like proprotein convertase family protein